ncbi:hypothetical protein TNCV_3135911 [Trichonephila clavipes]|nr:hypothetical protein TNCV_3135911 [Trichonephila clavipes]
MKVKIESLRQKNTALPNASVARAFPLQQILHSYTQMRKVCRKHLAKECSKPIDQKPKCCLCEGEHPASFLGCPRNPRNKIEKEETTNKKSTKPVNTIINTPAPPKVNFWEQREKIATPLQQPNPSTSKKPSQAPPSPAPYIRRVCRRHF